jgi:hypothetical protein
LEPSKLVLVSAEANQVLLQSPILSARAGVNHIFIWIITHPSYKTLILTMMIPIGAVITPFQLKCPKSLDLILTMNSNQTYLNLILD